MNSINPMMIKGNVFKLIAEDWALIGAGNRDKFNMMTASWLNMGELWNEKIVTIFVRPQRYTYEFTEREKYFSVSFFDEQHRDMLKTMGSKSGREIDKMHYEGLTPVFDKTVYFEEAKLTLICRKLYYDDLNPKHFLESFIQDKYPINDYHRFYIGLIEEAFVND